MNTSEVTAQIDVAVNVLAKPFCTSLSILSLLRHSRPHIAALWLQFEPVGIEHDPIPAYCIYDYIRENNLVPCQISQPDYWLDLKAVTSLADAKQRSGIRYQHAFENSKANLLFLMHNDVFIMKDILGAMLAQMQDAFAIGPLGQCWNCPAANQELMAEMGLFPCSPANYQHTRLNHAQLCGLCQKAKAKGIFVRPYAIENEDFTNQPWPLPECRINEWACLINLEKTRKFCVPFGKAWPPGAYKPCGEHNLDIGVAWFRDMHAKGMHAKHFDTSKYLRHWVGTGNNTPMRYIKTEDNALRILRKHFPAYADWLNAKYGAKIPQI